MGNPFKTEQGGAMGQHGQPAQMTAQQAIAQLQADPAGVLGQLGLNIPAGMTNPQQMVQHLMQSGQVPQGQFAQAIQMMGQMVRRR